MLNGGSGLPYRKSAPSAGGHPQCQLNLRARPISEACSLHPVAAARGLVPERNQSGRCYRLEENGKVGGDFHPRRRAKN
ncbi:hypothetical protein AAFF_G00217060 [Aldrovandia affinis]|uniref:Uncharacterized protein n=1 Tax=Aldrovandia affinis TaxID=143900 RepID=A0AAD7WUF0_9TELE|nr:hypothetical protein AAFF_G00217060 [Aldrovandia affinis]